MLLKTGSVEVASDTPEAVLVALQLGTIESALLALFNGAEIGRPAVDAAGGVLRVWMGRRRRKQAASTPTAVRRCSGES